MITAFNGPLKPAIEPLPHRAAFFTPRLPLRAGRTYREADRPHPLWAVAAMMEVIDGLIDQ
jgi:hypothetical protein